MSKPIIIRLLGLIITLFPAGLFANEVNLYSARKESLIRPLLDRFTQQTGIQVNLISGQAAPLIKRLQSEGKYSPADLLWVTDVAHLHRASMLGLFQSVHSDLLASSVPGRYRDPELGWYGLSLRARVLIYSPERVRQEELKDYLSLMDEKWAGRICVRSSSSIYNQSLLAALILHYGQEVAAQWANGLVKNLARSPKGGDRDQIRAVATGQCDLAIVNTYYLAGMLNAALETDVQLARSVRLFWPDQDGHGTHINISGIGMYRYARHKEQAIRLLEYLLNDEAQQWFAHHNHEYPVKPGIKIGELLASWGTFKAEAIDLTQLGRLNKEAVLLMDRAGWR